jgi:hypothetical protein
MTVELVKKAKEFCRKCEHFFFEQFHGVFG